MPDQPPRPDPEGRRTAPPARSTVPVPGARGTSGWVAWIALASVGMVLLGFLHVAQGLIALLTGEQLLLAGPDLLLDLDADAWAAIHVVVGAVLMVAGVLVLAGRRWARAVGVAAAVLSALSALSWGSEHPVWTGVVVFVDVMLVLALTAHGDEIEAG